MHTQRFLQSQKYLQAKGTLLLKDWICKHSISMSIFRMVQFYIKLIHELVVMLNNSTGLKKTVWWFGLFLLKG